MPSLGLEVFYLEGATGRLFCVMREPPAGIAQLGAVLYFHPFAEELNRSRRMASLQASALASAGWSVLMADAHGCGDSEGDFGAASWDGWIEDGMRMAAWLSVRTGFQPLLWGLRAGCLVAAAVAARQVAPPGLLFWQPVSSGKLQLQQFLRLKVAGAMLGEGQTAGEGTRQLRNQLAAGKAIEVAGYTLSPALATGLDAAALRPPAASCRVAMFEVANAVMAFPSLSPAVAQLVEEWRGAGWEAEAQCVAGAAFWHTVEIEEVPALLPLTVDACASLLA